MTRRRFQALVVEGPFRGWHHRSIDLSDFWSLPFHHPTAPALIEIVCEDPVRTVFLYGSDGRWWTFRFSDLASQFQVYGRFDAGNSEILGVVDPRWPLVYFLPKEAGCSASEAISAAETAISSEKLEWGCFTQSGDAVMKTYNEMIDRGEIDECFRGDD